MGTGTAPRGWAHRLARFLPVLTVLLGALFLSLHFDLKPVVGDEGVTAVDAWRMTRGELPQRDYFEIIPPLSAWSLVAVFKVLGVSVVASRLLAVVYGLALLGLAWTASRALIRAPLYQASALAVLVPFGVGVWPIPSHHWLADLLLFAALLALLQAAREKTFLWAAAAGAALSATCFTLQDQGGLAALAVFGLVLPAADRTRRRPLALGLAAGGLLAAALLLAPLLSAGLPTLWSDWVMAPLTQYRRIPDNVVGLRAGWSQLLGQWAPEALRRAPLYTGTVALGSMVLYALPLLFPPVVFILWRSPGFGRYRVALLAALGLAFLGTAFHRWSLMNLIWAAPLPMLGAGILLDRLDEPDGTPRARFLSWLTRSCAAFLLLVFLGFGFLRCLFVLRTPGLPISGAAGSYRTFNPNEARQLQEFLDAIEARVPRDGPAFVRGYLPLVSFLALRPNPTPFTFYLPSGYHAPEQAARWTRALDEKRVPWGFSAAGGLDMADPADAYLAGHYSRVWQNQTYALWERKP